MSKIKLSDLTELTAPSSNTKNTYFIVTDIQSGTPVSKKMSAFTLDTLFDVTQGQANLAFNHANSAFIQSNSAFIHSNSSFNHSNSAYQSQNATGQYANSSFVHANSAYESQNATGQYANAAFIHANSGFIQTNSAFIHTNSAYESQNATGQYANAAFLRANNSLSANVGGTVTGDVSITGNLTVSGITTYVNTQTVLVADNILTLNAAVNQSGSPISDAGIEIDRGNEANVYILWNETTNKWTFTEDGTNYDTLGGSSASSYANSAFNHANSAFIQVNSAFDIVNASAGIDATQNNNITASFLHASSAFDAANAAAATNITQNNSITSVIIHANSSFNYANALSNITLSFSATTILEVLNEGTSAYRFTQYGALDNPNVTTFSATTLGFKLNISGHPFHIRTGDDTADYNTGLVHVATDGTLSYDSAAQGKSDGTLFWRIPHTAVGNYKYRCANHPLVMLGDINIANTANIYFAHNT